ncbi:unnamed protein product [Arctogadus glacialis]
MFRIWVRVSENFACENFGEALFYVDRDLGLGLTRDLRLQRVQEDQPEQDRDEQFRRQRRRHIQELSRAFLIPCEWEHRAVLELLGLEAFCQDPDLCTLRSLRQRRATPAPPRLHRDDSTPRTVVTGLADSTLGPVALSPPSLASAEPPPPGLSRQRGTPPQ